MVGHIYSIIGFTFLDMGGVWVGVQILFSATNNPSIKYLGPFV